jgi:microcystin-dependent protein
MGCSNCFNGCPEIVSDQCVKYTGVDVPVLGIKKGDSLSYVEQAIIEFLTSTLDGTGIKINVPSNIICNLVKQYLPTCGDLTVVDLITALIKAACDLQTQVNSIKSDLAVLNDDYTIGCLTGVTASSDTHDIVQAIITKLCALDAAFTAFVLDVTTNYVKKSELNSLIQSYLDSISPSVTQQYQKMVPYTVVEYYGPTSNFDGDGKGIAGLGWDKIYICNGQIVGGFPTPDKRGRIPVGAIQNVPGSLPLDPVIAPGGFNPNYALYGTAGTNSVQLTSVSQIPSHTHVATVTLTNPDHTHFTTTDPTENKDTLSASNSVQASAGDSDTGGLGYALRGNSLTPTIGLTSPSKSDIDVDVVNSSTGGTDAHNNIPPVLACYYIMYIP